MVGEGDIAAVAPEKSIRRIESAEGMDRETIRGEELEAHQ
jgi:hypothetical protein